MAITLSANQISAVEGCPRAIQFRFGARLRSGGDSSFFTIGSAYHAALAAHYHNQINPSVHIDPWAQIDHEIAARAGTGDVAILEEYAKEVKRLFFWYADPNQPNNGVLTDVLDNVQPVQLEVLWKSVV